VEELATRLMVSEQESESHRRQAKASAERLAQLQERLGEAQARVDRQIREIAGLQESFLPARFPSSGGLSFAALCRPCAEIGGDYYDVFPMADDRVCIAMADVTGHGARAAVCMAMTRSLTRAAASFAGPGDGPGALLSRINTWLCEQLGEFQFVTMWLGLWDPEKSELHYARAGHPVGILVPVGLHPALLSDSGVPPLGLFPSQEPPPEDVLPLHIGDRLFLYTDGWTDSLNAEGNPLGVDGFMAAVEDTDGLALESVPLALYYQLERFLANAALLDDASLLILEHRPPDPA